MTHEFEKSTSGIFVTRCPENEKQKPEPPGLPVRKGFHVFLSSEGIRAASTESNKMDALRTLYIASRPSANGVVIEDDKARARELLDELSVLMVQGVPESIEQYT